MRILISMKNQLKRRVIILFVSFLLVTGISIFLNKASFDPNFSVMDAVTGATKRSHHNSSKADTITTWGYSEDDIVLQDETAYIEKNIEVKNDSYVVLKKADQPKDTLVILSDKDNSDYTKAVRQVAAYYEDLGYLVEIREYSETMMLSLAHAGHFDLFLLRKKETE